MFEKRIGIPFGRNKGIRHATGDICAFIDDDCIADPKWIARIQKRFSCSPNSVGIVGFSKNLTPDNIPSRVEQLFYERWLSENIPNITQKSYLLSGLVMDFKNCSLRRSFIKNYLFSRLAPYGDVGDEDVEMGGRLFKINKYIYFDPSVIVHHENSKTIFRLLYKNFWLGYSNRILLKAGLDVRKKPIHVRRFFWFIHVLKEMNEYNDITKKVQFLSLLFLYPVVSNLGRLYASLSLIFSMQQNIPQRG